MDDPEHDEVQEEPNETLSTVFDEDGSFCYSFSSVDPASDMLSIDDQNGSEKDPTLLFSQPQNNLAKEEEPITSLRENCFDLSDIDKSDPSMLASTKISIVPEEDDNSLRLHFSPSMDFETDTIIAHSSARRESIAGLAGAANIRDPSFSGTPKRSRVKYGEFEENSLRLRFSPSMDSETDTIIAHSSARRESIAELGGVANLGDPFFSGTPKRSRVEYGEFEENSLRLHFSPSMVSETDTIITHSHSSAQRIIAETGGSHKLGDPFLSGTPKRSRVKSGEYEENSFHLHFSPSMDSETDTIITHSCTRRESNPKLVEGRHHRGDPLLNGTPKRLQLNSDEYGEALLPLHHSLSIDSETITHSSARRGNTYTGEIIDDEIHPEALFVETPCPSIDLDEGEQETTRTSENKSVENGMEETETVSVHPATLDTDPGDDTLQGSNAIRGNNRHSENRQKSDQYVKDLFHAHKNASCPNHCLKQFSLQDIQSCRDEVRNMKVQEVKHFVMNILKNQTAGLGRKTPKTHFQTDLMILGITVCSKCWCIVYGISDWRLRDSVARIKAGKTASYRMKTRAAGFKRERTTTALAWMTGLFKRMGDYMPHRETIHLPHSWSKRYLYERMVSELHSVDLPRKGNVISYEHFTRIWKCNLSQYVISKTSDFTKCSVCTQLSDQYEKAKSPEGRANIARLKAEHDGQVERERKAYHDARLSARQDPSQMTCIIVDGMDQSKTSIPHFVVEDKDNAHLAKLPVHFTGVLVHTASPEGKIPYIYHDVKHIPHDSNLTIHCITETLCELRDRLGKTLFLQMDNCGRENKNKYVLSYISLSVQLGIFKEAFVHFLPVGHTHEDIDQMFSCVARQLRCHNAFTLTDLEEKSSQSYRPHIKMMPVTMIQDVKEELLKHMAGNFTNHSKPLWFRFRKMEDNTYMHYKLHVNDSWKPAAESEWHMGLKCLKSCPDLSACLHWVTTSLAKTDFEKLCQELPHAYNARLSAAARQWWIDFLPAEIRARYEDIPGTKVWTLHHLLHVEKSTNVEVTDDVENVNRLQSHIMQECPEVSIGPQGKAQRGVTRVADFSSLKIGMLTAVHCEETNGRPYIATITEITSEGVTVSWMKGSWTGSWHPWIVRQKGQGKAYSTIVPPNSIILWDFALTKGNRLRQETVRELKTKYAELDSGQNC